MLYEEIVDYIISNIESGGIVPGEKLPSIRKIAHKFGVSNPTAVTAYGRLESLGYAVARERSGFVAVLPEESDNVLLTGVNSNVSNIEHMDEIVRLYEKSQNVSYAPFGVGVPSKKFYPNALLKKYSLKVLNSDQTCFSDYTLPEGRLDLRTQILKWIEPWVGIYSPEEVLITNGCLEAINLALSVFCKPQDIVAVESPCYFGMIRALKSQDLRAVEINTDPKDGIDPECLRKQIRKHNIKVLISTANAQNPLGFSMSDERKKEVLKVCESEGVRIIENDVYGDVNYSKVRPKTYKYFDRKNIVTYCSSFSKTLGP
ncbi:MAG: PLP-dependent aminotransferase family protein, partial [Bacteriovoracaceae bacterium]|nr:PLP-dependent aminotransferase family protein [Bacteriovoracaceae bacterium]